MTQWLGKRVGVGLQLLHADTSHGVWIQKIDSSTLKGEIIQIGEIFEYFCFNIEDIAILDLENNRNLYGSLPKINVRNCGDVVNAFTNSV